MNVHLAGAGRVGFHLAELLSQEDHDVTVIETDPVALEDIDHALDVQIFLGNAGSVEVLQEAGAAKADLFVAATGGDAVNLVAAAAAKGLGAKTALARVDGPDFVSSSWHYERLLGIDYVRSPERLAAYEVASYVDSPGIVAAEAFGQGLVQMRQVRVVESPTTDGKTLKDVIPPKSGVLLGAVSRNDEVFIPRGDATVLPGDVVTLVGDGDKMLAMQKRFLGKAFKPRRVAIMGGGSVGLHLARELERRPLAVKLFDRTRSRCESLASELRKTEVVCQDVTSRAALREERVQNVDVFVATTHDDERNIVASVLAKEVGARQAITIIHQPDFAPLVQKLGIDHAVTPRACLANGVLKLVRRQKVSDLAVLEEGQVEVLEYAVTPATPILNRRLKEIWAKFPEQALVAAIQRGGQVIVPSGDDAILAGDSVVLIAMAGAVGAVQKLFQR